MRRRRAQYTLHQPYPGAMLTNILDTSVLRHGVLTNYIKLILVCLDEAAAAAVS
jgi:hypothetical protein